MRGTMYSSKVQGNVFALVQIFNAIQCRSDIYLHLYLFLISHNFGSKLNFFAKGRTK
jgi:hypothetical protein